MINVLHVLDIAGIASIISHHYNKLEDGRSKVIFHEKNNISTTISKFYNANSYKKLRYVIIAGFIKSLKYDIVHIHGAESLIPIFKWSGKKIVLHYHGSDIREPERSRNKIRIKNRSLADFIIYNSKSMESKIITSKYVKKQFLPNLIDQELFSKTNTKKKGSLCITSNNHDKKKTISSVKNKFDADIIDLDIVNIPYFQMPKIFEKYETYVDIRIMPWGQTLDELSTTALQALSCGCNVFHNGKIIKEFPKENELSNYMINLKKIYKEITQTKEKTNQVL